MITAIRLTRAYMLDGGGCGEEERPDARQHCTAPHGICRAQKEKKLQVPY